MWNYLGYLFDSFVVFGLPNSFVSTRMELVALFNLSDGIDLWRRCLSVFSAKCLRFRQMENLRFARKEARREIEVNSIQRRQTLCQ